MAALLFPALILTATAADAQEPERRFDRLRAHTVDNRTFRGVSAVLMAGSLEGRSADGTYWAIPRSRIMTIEYLAGSRWREGMEGGAGYGVGLSVGVGLYLLISGSDAITWSDYALGAVGVTAATAGFGALFGSFRERWELLVLNPRVNPRSPGR